MDIIFTSTKKITSADIKSVLKCNCGNHDSKKFKRISKHTYKNFLDSTGNLIDPVSVMCRAFQCTECDKPPINILEMNNELYCDKDISEVYFNHVHAPNTALDYTLEVGIDEENDVILGLWVKDEVDYFHHDNLGEYNTFYIDKFLFNNGISVFFMQENMAELTINPANPNYHLVKNLKTVRDLISYVRSLMKKIGIKLLDNEEIGNDEITDEQLDLEITLDESEIF